jgi:hypothetical protein
MKACPVKNSPEYKRFKKLFPEKGDLVISSVIISYQNKFDTIDFPSDDYMANSLFGDIRNENFDKFRFSGIKELIFKNLSKKERQNIIAEKSIQFPGLDIRLREIEPKKYKLVAFNKKESSDEFITREAFINLADSLSNRLGVNYEVINKEKAREILGSTYNDESAFYYNNKVYFTEYNKEDAIHEFAHPFVRGISKLNNPLFINIMNDIIDNHSYIYDEVKNLYPEYFKDGEVINPLAHEEMAVRAITKLAQGNIDSSTGKSVIQRLWDTILNFIEAITGISVKNLKPTSTLKDLADLLTSYESTIEVTDNTNIENLIEPTFNRESQPKNISVEHSTAIEFNKERLGDNLTTSQIHILNKLVDNKLELVGDQEYTDGTKTFQRASAYIKKLEGPDEQPDYYTFFEEDETKYSEFREWGNQYDDLIQGALLGYTFEESYSHVIDKHSQRSNLVEGIDDISIPEEELKTVYNNFINLLENDLKDYAVIPQVIFKSDKNLVAGTADVVAISPDGKLKIIDVKSSKVSFNSPAYRQLYNKGNSASTYNKYKAQLSVYKAMAKEQGFVFEETSELGIYSILSTSSNSKVIEDANPEGLYDIQAFQYILDKFTDKTQEPLSKEEINTVNKIKKVIEQQLFILQRNTNIKAGDFKRKEIENFKDVLSTIERSKMLYTFIDETYNTFVKREVGDKTYHGIKVNIRTLSNKIKKGEISGKDALEELFYYKSLVEIYNPIINELSAIFSNKNSEDYTSKIGELIEAFNQIKSDYKQSAIPLIADILFEQVNPEVNEKVKSYLNTYKQTLKDVENSKGKDSKEYKKARFNYNQLVVKLKSEGGITKEFLIKTLEEGSLEDISTLDYRSSPGISSSNPLVSLFTKHLKEQLENGRQSSIELERIAAKAFEEYVGNNNSFNPTEINTPFFENVDRFTGKIEDGVPVYEQESHFISEIDYNTFEKQFSEVKSQASLMEKGSGDFINEWLRENTELRSKEDITVTNPYTKEKVIIEKGLNTLIAEKQKQLDQGIILKSEFDSFIKSLEGKEKNGKTYYYNRSLLLPKRDKFKNQKYLNLNSKQKKYYDFLIATYLKAQTRVAMANHSKFRLPSVVKTGNERVSNDGVLNYLKYSVFDSFSIMEEDIDRYGERSSTGIKSVPILYANKMNSSDVSKDLLRSVMLYDSSSLIYEARTSSLPVGQSLLEIIKENLPQYRDALGNNLANTFSKMTGNNEDFIKSPANNVAKLLESVIDTQIFGESNIPHETRFLGKKIALDKISDSLKSYASKTQIGGINLIGAIANSLQANVQLLIEAHGGQYINKTEIAKAKAEYLKLEAQGQFIEDYNAGYPKSFIGQLMAIYDAMQGEYLDKYGNKITGTLARKLFSSDTWFHLHHKGEHEVQTVFMIAFLNSVKVKDSTGKEISLYNAYELDGSGKIKIKSGVELPGRKSNNGLISLTVQNRMHAINKRMHGVYNSFDKPDVKRHWWARLLFMYRDFAPPGFKKRYKTIGIDNELDDITEGYFVTFIRKAREDYKKLARELIGLENSNLQDWEKANLRKAIMEIGIVFSSGLIIMLLSALYKATDDEDKKYLKHLLFLSLRLNNEMGIYGTPGDPQNFLLMPNFKEVYKTFRQPTAMIGTLDRLFELLGQLSNYSEEYERDAGIFKKGDSKLIAKLYKLIGITGINVDPEGAIKHIQRTTK